MLDQVARVAGMVLAAVAMLSASASAGEWSGTDASAVAAYRLDMEKVKRWVDASRSISRVLENDPGLRARLGEESGNNESIAAMAARLDGAPAIRGAIRQAGLTGRDYVLVMLTLVQASLVAALLDDDPDARAPDGVNPANIQFVRAHRAELEAMRELLAPPAPADDEP